MICTFGTSCTCGWQAVCSAFGIVPVGQTVQRPSRLGLLKVESVHAFAQLPDSSAEPGLQDGGKTAALHTPPLDECDPNGQFMQ